MHNFGKLAARKKTFENTDPHGNVISSVDVLAFYDADGVEWHDLFRSYPCDFYVALTESNRVISFQSDPEQSQIADFTIIGISAQEAGDFATGEAYGKQWDGTKIDEPVTTREEFLPVTPRQLRLTLVRNGFSLASIATAIDALPDGTAKEEAQIDWEYATKFNRLDPTLLTIASAIGLTPEAIDAFWEQALAIA
ncbi:hypothetical protein [Rhizobium sp.]|uniref:hypothetical protein n=1 Tax=Rhizobium sp. TaxID=391 RepID=UPI0034C672D9